MFFKSSVLKKAKSLVLSGSIEAGILYLRQSGYSKGASIDALIEFGIPYAEAKICVHDSIVWADAKEGDAQLHAKIQSAMESSTHEK
ncbi:MAG: hypothetical protein ABL974_22495 [Prosthecobacter sp.]